MKKIIIATLLLFLSANVFAQSDDWASVRIPMTNYAEIAGYSNYKTYDLLTFSYSDELQETHGGRYSGPLYDWTSNPSNSDFKIISELKSLKITLVTFDKGVADFTGDVKAQIKVFDKDGKQIYSDLIQAVGVKFSTDKYATKDELKVAEKELFKEAYYSAVPVLLQSFNKDVKDEVNTKGEPMLIVKKAKGFPEAEKMNAEVTAIQNIKTEDPYEYKKELEAHKDFWKNEIATVQGDKASLLKGVALYNLAFLDIFTDDFKSAMSCMEQLQSTEISKDAKAKIGRIYEIYQKKFTPEPPMAHSDSYTSKVSIDQLLSNAKYLELNGTIELKNGESLSGKCLITRRNMYESDGGQIVSLDKADYWVSLNDSKKIKLSEVKTITTADGDIYQYNSGELLKRVYTSAKIDVYKPAFPEESKTCYFQKPGGKLESSPLIGGGKWLKNLFGDCPELVSKIDSKEIKDELEMARYYGDSCK